MNVNRRVNSIARRIAHSWQWRRLWHLLLTNIAALAACFAAYLYVQETAVTGAFAGWDLPRALTASGDIADMAFFRSAVYSFDWAGTTHTVPLMPFFELVALFGRPLLIAEGALWLLGFTGGKRSVRRLLRPLDRMAQTAQRLTDAAAKTPAPDEARFHDLEHAIERIDMGGRLSTGDKDLKGLEDAINDLLDRMHAAYRQQAQFVSDASHELRTPIAVIQGYAAMLDRWGKEDPQVLEESIAAIKTEAEHMKVLVEQLLFLARGDNGRQPLTPEPMDLSEMAAELLEEYRMIDPDHDWRQGRLDAAPVSADPALIKQAARILIDNAKRYTPGGASIRLSAGTDGGNAWLQVQDNGMGIGEEDVPRIFDRFFQADPARQKGGTGLGLSIAQWIVENHGGCFEVTSRPELGTRIRMVLPVREETTKKTI
ncbi:MAG: HAMP domain-containing histidine kinase [Clostridiales bacterium]|nr:HAMP domain-containing histidine kinase [Clostridiales bacterium]